MLRLLFGAFIIWFNICINALNSFILDRLPNFNITFFHFLLFTIFISISIRLVNFIKQVQEVESEKKNIYTALTEFDEYKQYQGWLKRRTRK